MCLKYGEAASIANGIIASGERSERLLHFHQKSDEVSGDQELRCDKSEFIVCMKNNLEPLESKQKLNTAGF